SRRSWARSRHVGEDAPLPIRIVPGDRVKLELSPEITLGGHLPADWNCPRSRPRLIRNVARDTRALGGAVFRRARSGGRCAAARRHSQAVVVRPGQEQSAIRRGTAGWFGRLNRWLRGTALSHTADEACPLRIRAAARS